jgi:sortase A
VPQNGDANVPKDLHLVTLTTCHPRFSARQRLVMHAALVDVRRTGA